MKFVRILILLATMLVTINTCYTQHSLRFNFEEYQYKGTPIEQAEYLLREHFMEKVDSTKATLPRSLKERIGFVVSLNKRKLVAFLSNNGIKTSEIGGSLNDSLCFIKHNDKKKYACYFVIHDASYPSYYQTFPKNINTRFWIPNKLNNYKDTAHFYINRLGQFRSVISLSTGWRATKFESKILGEKSRGLFIHVELVQPRVYPPGDRITAPIAPDPGFTSQQYRTLALVYIVASFKKGEWLIPAYHACIDEGFVKAHDDPQKFDLKLFSEAIDELVEKVSKMEKL